MAVLSNNRSLTKILLEHGASHGARCKYFEENISLNDVHIAGMGRQVEIEFFMDVTNGRSLISNACGYGPFNIF